jgi:coenzyme F420-dependent glucose-6-phosphate dehydrogenase
MVHLATTDQPKITSRRPINPETVWGNVKEVAYLEAPHSEKTRQEPGVATLAGLPRSETVHARCLTGRRLREGKRYFGVKIGYALSSEEFGPHELVNLAERAEAVGFDFAVISDHFHPWLDRQGQSPFVWAVIGAIARATRRLPLGTAVTCPINRVHPAIIAQAAATAGALMPDRFFLGVGTGENLNEHILARHWPEPSVRLEMLEEAVAVIRKLWSGGSQSIYGKYFRVENARIYTLPEPLPPIYVAAAAPGTAELAGRIGDGLISTAPNREVVDKFRAGAARDNPRLGGFTACVADDESEARRKALDH